MNTKKILIGVAIIAVLGLVYYFLTNGTKNNQDLTTTTPTTEQGTPTATSTGATATSTSDQPIVGVKAEASGPVSVKLVLPALVALTDSGFSPSLVTIKKGDTVLFVNRSSKEMWVASDPHPAHSDYSGTTLAEHCPDTAGVAFDECSSADSYSFTFGKTGTWGFHNHGTGDGGEVIVQ